MFLNDALERDGKAITELVNHQVGCNAELAAHPTAQVTQHGDIYKIGILGLLNGAIGNSPSGDIGAKGKLDSSTGRFILIKRFVDLREEKVDVLA